MSALDQARSLTIGRCLLHRETQHSIADFEFDFFSTEHAEEA